MLGLVATIKVKEGQGAEFEKVASELVKKVNENEKGVLLYVLFKAEEPNTYVFMERYADQAAVEAHRGTEHMKTLGRALGAFMEGRPELKRLQQVAG
jgi:quinol monooxygenase YgiN